MKISPAFSGHDVKSTIIRDIIVAAVIIFRPMMVLSLQRLSDVTTFAIRFMKVIAQVVHPFVDHHNKIGAKGYMALH